MTGKNDDDVISIYIEEGTIGGNTYHVQLDGDDEQRPLCWRARHGNGLGFKCTRPAGWQTDHPGTGACGRHGGGAGAPIQKGRKAYVTRSKLANKIDDLLANRAVLTDLSKELAAAKAVFEEMIENAPNYNDDEFGTFVYRLMNLTGTIGTLVDKISKIETRSSLTAAQVVYLRAAMVDVILKYINPDERERVIQEILFRMGGSDSNAALMLSVNGHNTK